MAWQLLNRAFTIGTVDGAGDITPGAAQSGFRDFSSLVDGNDTYVVAVQGTSWSYMHVKRVGAILRPQSTKDSSTGSPITFDTGQPITVFSDIGKEDVVYNDKDGKAQNAEGILKQFSPETLAELKTTALPSSGKTVVFLRGILADDNKGQFYVWDPNEATSGDDFYFVVSSLSATGRWARLSPIIEVPALASDGDAYDGSIYGVSDDLRHKSSASLVKKIPRTENYFVAKYATLAALKAVVINDPNGDPWADNDEVILTGWISDGDLDAPLKVKWDKDSTNTDSLDVTFIRPDNIAGANPGRYQIMAPVRAIKFANSDATPSVKDGIFFTCADTVPAAITSFDEMRDGRRIIVQPGAQDQVFTHSANFKMPNAEDFTLRTADAPVQFYKENGVISMLGGGGAATRKKQRKFTGDGAATTFDVPVRVLDEDDIIVMVDRLALFDDEYSVAVDTPAAGQSRVTIPAAPANGAKVRIWA